MALEQELETYQRELSRLMQDQGRFVVIFQDRIVGIFGDYEDALRAGYTQIGLKPFLVKKIEQTETLHHFTRNIAAVCRT